MPFWQQLTMNYHFPSSPCKSISAAFTASTSTAKNSPSERTRKNYNHNFCVKRQNRTEESFNFQVQPPLSRGNRHKEKQEETYVMELWFSLSCCYLNTSTHNKTVEQCYSELVLLLLLLLALSWVKYLSHSSCKILWQNLT